MKVSFYICIAFLFVIQAAIGCRSVGDSSVKTLGALETKDPTEATIINKTGLDGCSYMIQLADGRTLEADIPEEFQQDGLKVWVGYTPTEKASQCMAGKAVNLVTLVKAEDALATQGIVTDARGTDGCQFLVKLQNGTFLETNVPEKYRVDGLKIDLTYAPTKGRASICMMGAIVTTLAMTPSQSAESSQEEKSLKP